MATGESSVIKSCGGRGVSRAVTLRRPKPPYVAIFRATVFHAAQEPPKVAHGVSGVTAHDVVLPVSFMAERQVMFSGNRGSNLLGLLARTKVETEAS